MNPSAGPPFDIALDISFLSAAGGIGTYTAGLLRALAETDSGRRYLLISNGLPATVPQYARQEELRQSRMPVLPEGWQIVPTSIPSRPAWLLTALPRILREYRPRLYHGLDSVSLPFARRACPLVVTLHDIIPLTHPRFCRWRDTAGSQLLMRRAIRRAERIITVSHYSAGQIREWFPGAAEKIQVIHSGVDAILFHPVEDRAALAQSLAKRWDLPSPHYLFCAATLSPRRNLERFLEAFALFGEASPGRDVILVIAGCRGWKEESLFEKVHQMKLENRVRFLDFVTDAELVQLYQAALGLANPSLIEGFGFPVLEAMACGTPVICSSTTALGEIAGGAAGLFDPMDIESMREAIRTLVEDETTRARLAQQGLERAGLFSWRMTAEQTVSLYNQIIQETKP
ncbi:MAG: glycosyltransferase family 4 protein [bacterium]